MHFDGGRSDILAALTDELLFDKRYFECKNGLKFNDNASAKSYFLENSSKYILPSSGYFDPHWYLKNNPDVRRANLNPLYHYILYGRAQRLWPAPYFNGERISIEEAALRALIEKSGLFVAPWYLHCYPDIARAQVDPLDHYIHYGAQEGRQPNVLFNPGDYTNRYPEITKYGWNPLHHFVVFGGVFCDNTHPLFDAAYYKTKYMLKDSGEPPLVHYFQIGQAKGLHPNPFFDPRFYLTACPEAERHPGGLIGHYLERGFLEGLNPSEHFDTMGYLRANRDVKVAGMNPLVHFLAHGRKEGRSPKPTFATEVTSRFRFGAPDYGATDASPLRYDELSQLNPEFRSTIGVHLHLFYASLAQEFRDHLSYIPALFSLYISVPEETDNIQELTHFFKSTLPLCRSVEIRPTPNRGRDIAAFVVEFGQEMRRHDLVLHLHSKRSKHNGALSDWRRFLLHHVLGNRSIVTQILNLFAEDRSVGIFSPPYHSALRSQPNWGRNREIVDQLLQKMDLGPLENVCPNFPAGSFFWARTEAISPIFDLNLNLDDFEEETGLVDGTHAHAIERLLGVVPSKLGYRFVSRYVDVAHNLIDYYHPNRPYKNFQIDRCSELAAFRKLRSQVDRRSRIAVITAIMGAFDALLLPEVLEENVDYICYSDTSIDGYGVFQIIKPNFIDADPRRTARYVKTNLPRLLSEYEFVVWIDANVLLRGRVSELVQRMENEGYSVSAIPHPIRETTFDEAVVCRDMELDDAAIIDEQITRYLDTPSLRSTPLIETNVIIFSTRDPRVHEFSRLWWNEINRGSRRDQLSVNYALHLANLPWLALLEERRSTRDSGIFALFEHGVNQWTETRKLYPWHKESPYAGEQKSAKCHSLPNTEVPAVDVVICVHNALSDTKKCLESIWQSSLQPKIIVVDDASNKETQSYLVELEKRSLVTLTRHETRLGYTKSANAGLDLCGAPIIVLLNSDTILPVHFFEKMVKAFTANPSLGILGPLSNAASFQSVPSFQGTGGQTAINELPPDFSIDQMDNFFESLWDGIYPRTPLVHGFCLGIRRSVLEAVGKFDEVAFPHGYGEENDFCFRAGDAGFEMGILTNSYVFHAKSKSYSSVERERLMGEGMEALCRKHGRHRIARAVKTMEKNPWLEFCRQRTYKLFIIKEQEAKKDPETKLAKILNIITSFFRR